MTRFRNIVRAGLERRLAHRPACFDACSLAADAIVFAPHPDDETLGCGGTICSKRAAGARVRVVVMTDGSRSHAPNSSAGLAARRKDETLGAAAVLGLAPADVTFLDFVDGKLTDSERQAEGAVCAVLKTSPAAQLFLPCRDDGHPDHAATYRAVSRAAAALGLCPDVYEYPVWAWRHWPWVGLAFPHRDELPPWRATLKFGFGLRFVRTFNVTSNVSAVLDAKRAALAEYLSQTGASDRPGLWSLAGISRGEFLRRFEGPVEVFRRTPGKAGHDVLPGKE